MKTAAMVWGVIFLLVGILGFIPGVTTNGFLFGIFHVDTLHNLIHLLTGALAIVAGSAGTQASRVYFQAVGIIYAVIALLGILYGRANLLGIIASNAADTWLHIVMAAVALYLGYLWMEERHPTTGSHAPRA